MTRFEVFVTPRSSRPGPDGRHGGLPRLRVSAAPTDGRANEEAERLLSRALGTATRLSRGSRSRRKTFEADLESTELEARIRKAFDGY